jgi:hypothetical protein
LWRRARTRAIRPTSVPGLGTAKAHFILQTGRALINMHVRHSQPDLPLLIFALGRSRAQFAWRCGDLDAAGLNRPHPPSTMTLGGLIKQMALCRIGVSSPLCSAVGFLVP